MEDGVTEEGLLEGFEELFANADKANNKHEEEMKQEGRTCSLENPEDCEGCGS
jgi:hypothetical protein